MEVNPSAEPSAKQPVSIRTAILRGSLALVLIAIVLSGSLSFFEFRRAFQSEIAHNLSSSAVELQERTDVFFFERIEDMREWRRVELMQDIKIGDVDKRLARLLSDLKTGHGDVYLELYCTNKDNRIVAASDPALVGKSRAPGKPMRAARQAPTSTAILVRSSAGTPEGAGHFVLQTPVPNAFGTGKLGYLYAVLNWDVVERFLSKDIEGGARTALLLDTDHRVIAAAGPLAASMAGKRFDPRALGHGDTADLLTGNAGSHGYQHFSGFGWHTAVVEPTDRAYAPVWRQAWVTLAVLVFSLIVTGWLSVRFSIRLASPLAALTAFARNFRRGRQGQPPAVRTAVSEVDELSRAFAEMIEALDRSREHLVRAGKLAVVGEMAAIMAHEVRTPLGILKTSAQMLQRRHDTSSEARELIGFIVSETDRLNRLVTTLLECASPQPPHFERHDLHEIIRHVLDIVRSKAEKKGMRIETSLKAREPVFDCDREQMIQVFLNLFINATQHGPANGRIRIASRDIGDSVEFRCEDNGPGIAPSELERVFDPFYTRRKGGIGLGLTIVQQIVRAHGGDIIAARSGLGGAAFVIRFDGKGR